MLQRTANRELWIKKLINDPEGFGAVRREEGVPDLAGADLANANLRFADLSGANRDLRGQTGLALVDMGL